MPLARVPEWGRQEATSAEHTRKHEVLRTGTAHDGVRGPSGRNSKRRMSHNKHLLGPSSAEAAGRVRQSSGQERREAAWYLRPESGILRQCMGAIEGGGNAAGSDEGRVGMNTGRGAKRGHPRPTTAHWAGGMPQKRPKMAGVGSFKRVMSSDELRMALNGGKEQREGQGKAAHRACYGRPKGTEETPDSSQMATLGRRGGGRAERSKRKRVRASDASKERPEITGTNTPRHQIAPIVTPVTLSARLCPLSGYNTEAQDMLLKVPYVQLSRKPVGGKCHFRKGRPPHRHAPAGGGEQRAAGNCPKWEASGLMHHGAFVARGLDTSWLISQREDRDVSNCRIGLDMWSDYQHSHALS
ncbi:hypothetical protein B0H14DRAFT_3176981 [Mycena olivaceomarginata]|nr:hypothetical protein B0H14DRAFT_3176981 [Mycena olivaceomarginata]